MVTDLLYYALLHMVQFIGTNALSAQFQTQAVQISYHENKKRYRSLHAEIILDFDQNLDTSRERSIHKDHTHSCDLLLQLSPRRSRGDSDRIPLRIDVKDKQIQARAPIDSSIDRRPY